MTIIYINLITIKVHSDYISVLIFGLVRPNVYGIQVQSSR